jgi:hypothetical protein
MSAKAQALYDRAQGELTEANKWLNRANALKNFIQDLWNDSPWYCLPCKAVAKGVALLDGPLVNADMAKYQAAEDAYEDDMELSGQIQQQADTLYQNYAPLHAQAVAAKPKSGCHGFPSCAAHCVTHAASSVTHRVTHVATTAVTSTVHAAVSWRHEAQRGRVRADRRERRPRAGHRR